jgi:hypothetical protein
VGGSPELRLLRCPCCNRWIRCRPAGSSQQARLYDVELLSRRRTRRRVEVAWSPAQQRSLDTWLLYSSVVTLGLVGLLYLLARLSS